MLFQEKHRLERLPVTLNRLTDLLSCYPQYQHFTAGRSMRDVEHAAVLKITNPYGQFLD